MWETSIQVQHFLVLKRFGLGSPAVGPAVGAGGVGRFSSVVGSGSPAVGPAAWGPRGKAVGLLERLSIYYVSLPVFWAPPPGISVNPGGGGSAYIVLFSSYSSQAVLRKNDVFMRNGSSGNRLP